VWIKDSGAAIECIFLCGGDWIQDSGAAIEGVWCGCGRGHEQLEDARQIVLLCVFIWGLGCGRLTAVATGDARSSVIPPSLKSSPFPSDTARRKPSTMKMLVRVRKNSDVP
jgi:hypothetical protein